MLGQALVEAEHVVREITKTRGAAQQRHIGTPTQRSEAGLQPFRRWMVVHLRVGLIQQRATELGLFIAQEHASALGGSRKGGGDAGRACADHQHIAVREALRVSVRVRFGRWLAKASGLAHYRFEHLVPSLPWPHESLVVEASGEQRRQQVVHRAHVELQRRPTVLAFGHEAFVEFHLRSAQVRRATRSVAHHGHQGVGFFHAGGQQAARTVVLERTAHEMHAVGEQGRSQCVADMAGKSLAIESEVHQTRTIDTTASGGAASVLAHRWPPAGAVPDTAGRGSPHL